MEAEGHVLSPPFLVGKIKGHHIYYVNSLLFQDTRMPQTRTVTVPSIREMAGAKKEAGSELQSNKRKGQRK